MKYFFNEIEKKWQKYWEENNTFIVSHKSSKPKYYVLDMFPYPSGSGLHVGHPLGYIASDIVSRYKRHQGYNVLHPMGFDSFGLPGEQYAIETGQHPAITTEKNISRYRKQLKKLGFSYDWSREVKTSSSKYYKWTQWIFLKLFNHYFCLKKNKAQPIDNLVSYFQTYGFNNSKAYSNSYKGTFSHIQWNNFSQSEKDEILLHFRLAYLAETNVNWCPKLGTVLANEEVINGMSERGGYPVVKKKMRQWMLRITAYAERLLDGLEQIDWPQSLKDSQRYWIGKSYGTEINFQIENHKEKITVFTTRPDTIFGVTFISLTPDHELVDKITTPSQRESVNVFLNRISKFSERELVTDTKRINGVWTGAFVKHPITKEKIPIWLGDYVLANYGTGAVMSVPSGDQRDHNFAKHYSIAIKNIFKDIDVSNSAYEGNEGILINSGFLNGLSYMDAIKTITLHLEKSKLGKSVIKYRMRDAVFSRQRYWGEPIPVYYKNSTPSPINEKYLPLELVDIKAYLPTEQGEPPLGRSDRWAWDIRNNKVCSNKNIDCKTVFPLELNTMPGWAGSSWYFNRFMDANNNTEFASSEALNYWKDVDLYIGGSEHSTGHLLYSRFWQKFLFDIGKVPVDEFARKLINQGMILGNSALIHRVRGTNIYVSSDLSEAHDTEQIHVDINLVDLKDELNIASLKDQYKKYSNAKFQFSKGKFLVSRTVEKMSKRWLNVINPDDICQTYGADALRMYEMFMGPLELSKPWNTNGLNGVLTFLRKFWNLYHSSESFNVSNEKASSKELKIIHSTIKKVTDDIERYSFNTCVSSLMIAVNEIQQLQCNKRIILEPLVILISPFAPHLAEELWQKLGYSEGISFVPYPMYDERLAQDTMKNYPISINGKMKFLKQYPINWDKDRLEKAVLSEEQLNKYVDNREVIKIIIIPGKAINFVVK